MDLTNTLLVWAAGANVTAGRANCHRSHPSRNASSTALTIAVNCGASSFSQISEDPPLSMMR